MNLLNLTPEVRARMVMEIVQDVAAHQLFLSPRLSPVGVKDYPGLFQEAAAKEGITWLAGELRLMNRLKAMELYTNGGITRTRKVPSNAADLIAEGDFNRYYCRGLCLDAMATDPNVELEIYRAKAVTNPRPGSERLIGTRVRAVALLADLRSSLGVDTVLGIPAGPNSGLSVRLLVAL